MKFLSNDFLIDTKINDPESDSYDRGQIAMIKFLLGIVRSILSVLTMSFGSNVS